MSLTTSCFGSGSDVNNEFGHSYLGQRGRCDMVFYLVLNNAFME
jgi:hypothetical protein